MRAKASVKLTVPNGPRVNVGGGGTENHAKLKNLEFEESGHIGFQKELTPAEREAIASVAGKEDKANKIQSIDELQNNEQYLSAGGTLALAKTAENSAKAHADGLYNELSERVATNEESIAGAFGAIQGVESRVGDLEVAESDIRDRVISLEDNVGEFETALDTAIALCDGYISGGAV